MVYSRGVTLGIHELAPGQMAVEIVAHQAGPMPCWSFISRGLVARGQREIVLTLSAGPGDNPNAPPLEPLQYYDTVWQLAGQGNLVAEDGFTGFGGAGMLGAMGLAYGRAIAINGVAVPADALVALLLTGPEAELANAIGTTRVLTRLGRAYRYYPHPFWSDRARQSVVAPGEDSLLSSVAIARVPGALASLTEKMVAVRVPRAAVPILASLEQLPANAGLALMCGVDYQASGHFVWSPGQPGPEAIHGSLAPPGLAAPSGRGRASTGPDTTASRQRMSQMAGSFVMFVPEQQTDSGQLFEDGFAFMLSDPSWSRLRRALIKGGRASVGAAPGGLSLAIEWV